MMNSVALHAVAPSNTSRASAALSATERAKFPASRASFARVRAARPMRLMIGAPRVGRNPRSGEQVVIPEKLVPHFKPGKALREAVDARAAVSDPPTG